MWRWGLFGAAAAALLFIGYPMVMGVTESEAEQAIVSVQPRVSRLAAASAEEANATVPALATPRLEPPANAGASSSAAPAEPPTKAALAASEPSAQASAAGQGNAPSAAPTTAGPNVAPLTTPNVVPEAPGAALRTVTLISQPAGAEFFLYGKRAGSAPFKVELAPGEKRRFEVTLKGHATQKVVIDGSQPQIVIKLRSLKKYDPVFGF